MPTQKILKTLNCVIGSSMQMNTMLLKPNTRMKASDVNPFLLFESLSLFLFDLVSVFTMDMLVSYTDDQPTLNTAGSVIYQIACSP